MKVSKVAVIGAGPSGLATVKALVEQGFDVSCFESEDDLGGIFNYAESAGRPSVWKNCRLVSSIFVTSFSDFMPEVEHRQYHHLEYHQYLTDYALRFGVLEKIKFRCRVTAVVREAHGGGVRLEFETDGTPDAEQFDAVAVCSGLHTRGFIPQIKGLSDFPGEVIHSSGYRTPESVSGRKTLVIGVGESGADIANELACGGRQVAISMRRGAFVLPRLVRGYPSDYFGTRLFYSLPDFLARKSDARSKQLRARYARLAAPVRLLPQLGNKANVKWQEWRHHSTGPSKDVARLIMDLRAKVGGTQFEYFATKSDAFLQAVAERRATLRPAVSEFRGDRALFADGSSEAFDSLVFCTGFEAARLPFRGLQVDLQRLYLRMLDPGFGADVAFIGFARPSLGAMPPISEMQARLWASILAGETALPSRAAMTSYIARDLESYADNFPAVHERLPHQVDFSVYLDELAELLGCKPTFSRIRDLGLALRVYATPYSAVQYRLVGPGARPDVARKLINEMPMTGDVIKGVDLVLSTLLSRYSRRFTPKLRLG